MIKKENDKQRKNISMSYQTIFKRYEIKYILTKAQQEIILQAMEPHMALDDYGRTTIRNLYFDTDNYRLIRRSIEKPAYKEKLRIRSYRKANSDTPVFVELKKKYKGVVYKRRVPLPEKDAVNWICFGNSCTQKTQITDEIDYFLDYYGSLRPTVFLSYEREAFYSKDGSDFRITFDDRILCRQSNLSLESDVGGNLILDEGLVLMEIKCSGGIPLWMTEVLSKERIYKTSFSKYGTAYQTLIYPKLKEETIYGNTI